MSRQIEISQESSESRVVAFLLLIVAGLLLIIPGLFMGFHADDWFNIRPRTWEQTFQTFSGEMSEGRRGTGTGFFRPITRLSFTIDHHLYGMKPVGYHLTNGLIFCWYLVVVFLCGITLTKGQGYLTTLLIIVFIGLNPLHHEAHYWLSGRTDLLASAFSFTALFALLMALKNSSWALAVTSLVALLGGLLSKEVGFAGVFILILAAFFFGDSKKVGSLKLFFLISPVLLGILYLIWRSWAIGGVGGYYAGQQFQMTDIARNFLKMLSAIFNPLQQGEVFSNFPAFLFILFMGFIYLIHRGNRVIIFCLLAMFLALLPMMGIGISPLDGGRTLLLANGFYVIFLSAIISRFMKGLFTKIFVSVFGVGIFLIFLGSSMVSKHTYLQAHEIQKPMLEDIPEILDFLPDGAILLTPEPYDYEKGFRILHPSTALAMAVLSQWEFESGEKGRDISDPAENIFVLELTEPNRHLTLSVFYQTWMKATNREIYLLQVNSEGIHEFSRLEILESRSWSSFTRASTEIPNALIPPPLINQSVNEGLVAWIGGASRPALQNVLRLQFWRFEDLTPQAKYFSFHPIGQWEILFQFLPVDGNFQMTIADPPRIPDDFSLYYVVFQKHPVTLRENP